MSRENETPRAAGTDTGQMARERQPRSATNTARGQTVSADEIKGRVSLADLLAADGHELRRNGCRWQCRCPFHEERTPSFFIFDDGRFHCFGCGARGDVFDYVQQRDGVSFQDAKGQLAEVGRFVGASSPASVPARPKSEASPHRLTSGELNEVRGMAEYLAGNLPLCERIATARGWSAETIRNLSLEPSLGWSDGKLAFIYECGVKLRWQTPEGERRFRFAFGNAQRLWRDWLLPPLPAAPRVFVTEGETDAITLLDAGMERGRSTFVVALPGASILPVHCARCFLGREVVLCLDADAAGDMATARIAELVRPYARAVSVLNWKEVRHAA